MEKLMSFQYWKYRKVSQRGLAKDPALAGLHTAVKYLWRVHHQGCLRRNVECTLTPQEFLELVSGACHYCGCQPGNFTKLHGENIAYNGIDRIENAIPYRMGNVVSCCKTCNSMKSKMPQAAFLNHIGKIFHHNRKGAGDYTDDAVGVESHRG